MKLATISVRIDLNMVRKVRNTVYWTPGMTLTKFVEQALSKAMEGKPEADKPMPSKKTLRSVPHFKEDDDE